MISEFAMDIAPLFGRQRRITYQGSKTIPDDFFPHLREGSKANTLLRQLLWRRKNNMNSFVFCCGRVRSGKSWFALKFQELYAEYSKQEYNVKKQVSFKILPFFDWSKTTTDSSFLLDEIQLSMGAREWFDIQHKLFNRFCDIYGYARNVLFMTCPNISFIDKHLRFLIDYVVHSTHQGWVEWYKVVTQHHLGKSYLPLMGTFRVSKPGKKTTDAYEHMKDVHNKGNLDGFIETLKNQGKPSVKNLSASEMKRFYQQDLMTDQEFKKMISVHGIPKKQIEMIIASKNKPVQTMFSHVCTNCGNEWRGKAKNPQQCPSCYKRGWKS